MSWDTNCRCVVPVLCRVSAREALFYTFVQPLSNSPDNTDSSNSGGSGHNNSRSSGNGGGSSWDVKSAGTASVPDAIMLPPSESDASATT
jgi:hypothetical protein